jgi:hypothetical protein
MGIKSGRKNKLLAKNLELYAKCCVFECEFLSPSCGEDL